MSYKKRTYKRRIMHNKTPVGHIAPIIIGLLKLGIFVAGIYFTADALADKIEDVSSTVMAGFVSIVAEVLGATTASLDAMNEILNQCLSLDYKLFDKFFPLFDNAYNSVLIPASGVIFLVILLWALFKSMFSNAEEVTDNPIRLLIKSGLFVCLASNAKAIYQGVFFPLFNIIYQQAINFQVSEETAKMLMKKDKAISVNAILGSLSSLGKTMGYVPVDEGYAIGANDTTTVVESLSSSLGGAGFNIIITIVSIVIFWRFLCFLFRVFERYATVFVLGYTSPLAFATGHSVLTNRIFKNYISMTVSSLFSLFLSVIFVKVITHGFVATFISVGGSTGLNTSYYGVDSMATLKFIAAAMFLALLEITKKIDSYLNSLGLVNSGMHALPEHGLGIGAIINNFVRTMSSVGRMGAGIRGIRDSFGSRLNARQSNTTGESSKLSEQAGRTQDGEEAKDMFEEAYGDKGANNEEEDKDKLDGISNRGTDDIQEAIDSLNNEQMDEMAGIDNIPDDDIGFTDNDNLAMQQEDAYDNWKDDVNDEDNDLQVSSPRDCEQALTDMKSDMGIQAGSAAETEFDQMASNVIGSAVSSNDGESVGLGECLDKIEQGAIGKGLVNGYENTDYVSGLNGNEAYENQDGNPVNDRLSGMKSDMGIQKGSQAEKNFDSMVGNLSNEMNRNGTYSSGALITGARDGAISLGYANGYTLKDDVVANPMSNMSNDTRAMKQIKALNSNTVLAANQAKLQNAYHLSSGDMQKVKDQAIRNIYQETGKAPTVSALSREMSRQGREYAKQKANEKRSGYRIKADYTATNRKGDPVRFEPYQTKVLGNGAIGYAKGVETLADGTKQTVEQKLMMQVEKITDKDGNVRHRPINYMKPYETKQTTEQINKSNGNSFVMSRKQARVRHDENGNKIETFDVFAQIKNGDMKETPLSKAKSSSPRSDTSNPSKKKNEQSYSRYDDMFD